MKNQNLGQSCALQTVSAIWISNPVLLIDSFLYLLVQRNRRHKLSGFGCRWFCELQTAVFILGRKVERDALFCELQTAVFISNIKRYRVDESKHNTLLRCKVSQGRRHVSALFYKAIIRSDMVKTNIVIFLFSFHHVRPDDGLIEKGRNML